MAELIEPQKIDIYKIKPSDDDQPATGCYIIQYGFNSSVPCTLTKITFKNDYTERITGYLYYKEPVRKLQ